MTSDEVVRARIDGHIKTEAAHVLANMGLTISDAIRLMLIRVATEKAMPFPVKVPNAKTRAAMEQADRGKLPRANSVADLMAELNEDD